MLKQRKNNIGGPILNAKLSYFHFAMKKNDIKEGNLEKWIDKKL